MDKKDQEYYDYIQERIKMHKMCFSGDNGRAITWHQARIEELKKQLEEIENG